jgi:hypothetical protein
MRAILTDMMKLFFAAILALSAIASAGIAQTKSGNPDFTGGFTNGRFWVDMPDVFKSGYVGGYTDSAQMMVGGLQSLPLHLLDKEQWERAIKLHFPAGMTRGEIVEALDEFYREPLNRAIPIANALRVIAGRVQGLDSLWVAKQIEDLRQMALNAREQR